MTISTRFLINVEPTQYSTIISRLKFAGFEVESLTFFEDKTPIPSQLHCLKKFFDWQQVVSEMNNIYNITGVNRIVVLNHDIIKDKQKWYKHWIFPLLIATAVNIVSLLILVYSLRPDTTLVQYVIISIVPPILSFASAVGIKHSS